MLADIELAQTLKSETEKAQEEMIETVPHPLDQDYNSLKCLLSLLDAKSNIFKVQSNEALTRGRDVSRPFVCAALLPLQSCSKSSWSKNSLLMFSAFKCVLFFIQSSDDEILIRHFSDYKAQGIIRHNVNEWVYFHM